MVSRCLAPPGQAPLRRLENSVDNSLSQACLTTPGASDGDRTRSSTLATWYAASNISDAVLAEGRRIERRGVTRPWGSNPVANHLAVPSNMKLAESVRIERTRPVTAGL